jgi:threonine/homoserine/homoserine lactone efflux protein
MNNLFLHGLVIGLSIAAPVGPIGVLSIRRTLAEGWQMGLLTGLGAATADAVYGCIAGFGLTWASNFLTSQTAWLRLVGGLFLCFLGIKTWMARPAGPVERGPVEAGQTVAARQPMTARQPRQLKGQDLVAAYLSAVFLTLTNPMTILAFAAVFAGLGLASSSNNYFSAIRLVAGVFTGSALWWLGLSSVVNLLRARFETRRLQGLNRISGAILLVFGIISLSSI